MLQRAKQRLGVIAQLKRSPQGSALPPKPLVGPGEHARSRRQAQWASRAPKLGYKPQHRAPLLCFIIRPFARDGKLIRTL